MQLRPIVKNHDLGVLITPPPPSLMNGEEILSLFRALIVANIFFFPLRQDLFSQSTETFGWYIAKIFQAQQLQLTTSSAQLLRVHESKGQRDSGTVYV